MKRSLFVAMLLILSLVFAACTPMEPAPDSESAEEPTAEVMEEEATDEPAEEEMAEGEGMNIAETAMNTEGFSTLVAALDAAGLVETLSGEGPFTVFAPTDDAFAALPEGTVDTLLEDPSGDLTQILLYHVVSGSAMAADVTDGLELETVQGSPVTFTVGDDGSVMINDANIITTDIVASNGVIHVIDAVLMPPSGDEAMDEEAMDEEAMDEEATAEPAEEAADEGMAEGEAMNIAETAMNTEGFSTLVAALDAAGLVETLSGEGPFTVFAPTDDAFAALPEGTVDTLLEDPSGDLTQILLYHVVSGSAMAADVTDGLELETVQGSMVTFSVGDDGSVMINDANVVATDIVASNGVIHVIDAVLIPPAE